MILSRSIRLPLIVVSLFWLIEIIEFSFRTDFNDLGIYPRTFQGLIGVFFSPFLHGNFSHLMSNSASFIILSTSMLFFYPRIAYRVIFHIYFATGMGVWLLARDSYHIGASGLIYGFAGFLFFSGIFRKDFKSLTISLIIALLYGSMLYGIFPQEPGVSWESHLIGAVIGATTAYYFRNTRASNDMIPPDSSYIPHFEGYANLENEQIRYEFKEESIKQRKFWVE